MKILMHETADFEVITAAKWIDINGGGLGEDFLQATYGLISSIASNPYQFSPASGTRHQDQLRVAFVKRFDYSIYFQVFEESSTIWIVAVQHTSRNPEKWCSRLGNHDLRSE